MRRAGVVAAIVLVATACYHPFDFDGTDKASRISARSTASGVEWYRDSSTTPFVTTPGTWAVAGDYDGDGRWEPASVSAAGAWATAGPAGTLTFAPPANPTSGDCSSFGYRVLPVPADYDGDHHTDPAWFRDVDATWFVSGQAPVQFGSGPTQLTGGTTKERCNQDVPVPADYDGDGRTDLATWRPLTGVWTIRASHDGSISTVVLAVSNHLSIPVPADYDGLGHAQPALWTDAEGWRIAGHAGVVSTFGSTLADNGLAVPADYDGDGRAELSVANWGSGLGDNWLVEGGSTVTKLDRAWPAEAAPGTLANVVRLTWFSRCGDFASC